ncbi:hypothetical protein [Enorma phocaeensis]|uniref:hypothetical protein n=1 Tax=Enorma phocaeensis TaxID=1871019 RepID=UPI000C85F551|nr:hypothetical protein [Enorma phocaeensis]
MLDAFITNMLPSTPRGFATWLVPIGFIALCFIARARRRAIEPTVPDIPAPDPRPPLVHPLLIGALNSRKSVARGSSSGAFDAALGSVVALVGFGALRFRHTPDASNAAPRHGMRPGMDSPVVTKRNRIPHRQRQEMVDAAFGETMLFTRDHRIALSPLDKEALALFMGQGSDRMTVADGCRRLRHGTKAYAQQKRFLKSSVALLKQAGLVTEVPLFEKLLGTPVVQIVQLWSLFVVGSMGGIGTGALFTVGVMIFYVALLERTPPLTPIGAQTLASARSNGTWAEAVTEEGVRLTQIPAGSDLVRLLATLVAMGDVQLATNLVERMAREGVFPADETGVQLRELFTRHPFDIDGAREASPVEYLHMAVEKGRQAIEDSA